MGNFFSAKKERCFLSSGKTSGIIISFGGPLTLIAAAACESRSGFNREGMRSRRMGHPEDVNTSEENDKWNVCDGGEEFQE